MRTTSDIIRLWTFQHYSVVEMLHRNGDYVPIWETTPTDYRPAYRWMAARLHEVIGLASDTPPVWCWHSCEQLLAPPTVGTAAALLSEYEIEQGMVTFELDVPADMALLSSYHEWNNFLDACLERNAVPVETDKWRNMFHVPPLLHEADDIQAVLPRIDSKWLNAVWPLRIEGRDWAEPVTAQRYIPHLPDKSLNRCSS
ncbi:MAG: DUF3841 domain-containing protein [Chloroflexales bacterium]|nr:DUF3841 domain-containing protein [Chloroflexales bacterium]